MSLPRFFLSDQVLAHETEETFPLSLNDGDLKHARVLRLREGEHISIVDAARDYFECRIVSFDSQMHVAITRHDDEESDLPHVVLMQGLCKGDKMDMVIRHATELGISKFVPLACKRSVVKLDEKKAASRVARWQSIARSAAMQSGRTSIPQVMFPVTVEESGDILEGADCVVICWEEERSCSLKQALAESLGHEANDSGDKTIVLCIGPEGGLSEEEVAVLRSCNGHSHSVTLGKSILRTETAGIVASALLLYELGGLQ